MAKAILTYTDDYNNNVTLESGSLFYVDQNTKIYKNIESLKEKYSLNTKGINGKIKLFYISSSSKKEEIPILINDSKPIYVKDDYLENQISEIEKGRKLLFNSKNKLFLRLALRYRLVKETFDYRVQLSKKQYDYASKKGLEVEFVDGRYFIHVKRLFEFIISNGKAEILREAFENSLEMWKRYINNMPSEELYYYSRNIRALIKRYNNHIRKKISIKNFEPRNENLKLLVDNTILLNGIEEIIKVRKKIRE